LDTLAGKGSLVFLKKVYGEVGSPFLKRIIVSWMGVLGDKNAVTYLEESKGRSKWETGGGVRL